jgi:hypothetical protein
MASGQFELKRMGEAVLPLLTEVMRWFDPESLSGYWRTAFAGEEQWERWMACETLKQSIMHATWMAASGDVLTAGEDELAEASDKVSKGENASLASCCPACYPCCSFSSRFRPPSFQPDQIIALAKTAISAYHLVLESMSWPVAPNAVPATLNFDLNTVAAVELCMLAATSGLTDRKSFHRLPARLFGVLLARSFPGVASAQDPDNALDIAGVEVDVATEGPLSPCGALPATLAANARARRALRVLLEHTYPLLAEFIFVCDLQLVLPLLAPMLHTLFVPGLEEEVNKSLLEALHCGVDRAGFAYWRARDTSGPTSSGSPDAKTSLPRLSAEDMDSAQVEAEVETGEGPFSALLMRYVGTQDNIVGEWREDPTCSLHPLTALETFLCE